MHIFRSVVVFCVILIFSACSFPRFSYNFEFRSTNYEEIIENLLDKASNQIFPNIKMDELLLVSNFAEITTLKSDTRLSFVLSDILKDKIVSKYSYTIREVELSTRFRLGQEGFKILTRKSNSVNNRIKDERYVVAGTYTLTKNQLILFLKLINIRDGRVLASSTYSTNLTQEISDLDSITVESENKIPTIYQPVVL